jgi:twitching motility protein PilT
MTRLPPDPKLEALLREVNEAEFPTASGSATPDAWPPPALPEGNPLDQLLVEMTRRRASDLLLLSGASPVFRIDGKLVRASDDVLSADEVEELLKPLLTPKILATIAVEGAADLSIRIAAPHSGRDAWRFRINLHKQRSTLAASVRSLPTKVPTLSDLHLPPSLAELVKPQRGLVLLCGPTGSGKSTSLAALIGEVNRTDSRHVVTIEDPIEFEHSNLQSVVEQVEVGRDSPSFATALRAALRQDPDVILVGEMRDLETVAIALTAAETGHLILSTLHTSDAAQAIHRIIDLFPAEQQAQIRQQLALTLNAIIVQHLIPRADGKGRAVAVELLLANQAVRNHIRNARLQNLGTELTLGKRQGMISLEDSLATLVRDGLISLEDARGRSSRLDELESLLRAR